MTDAEFQAFLERTKLEEAEAERKHLEKSRKVKACKRERAKKRKREKALGIYVAPEKQPPKTICFLCKNCIPNPQNHIGCEWSYFLEPVPGWNAIRNDLRPSRKDGEMLVSYTVIDCPKFVEG